MDTYFDAIKCSGGDVSIGELHINQEVKRQDLAGKREKTAASSCQRRKGPYDTSWKARKMEHWFHKNEK